MAFPWRFGWIWFRAGFRRSLATLSLLLGLGGLAARAEPAIPHRTVVILHSFPPDSPGLQELTSSIYTELRKGSPLPVDVYSEYTGLDRFTGPTYESTLLALYAQKYETRAVDLVIAVGPAALNFGSSLNRVGRASSGW